MNEMFRYMSKHVI